MYVLFRGKRKRPPDSGETLDLGAPVTIVKDISL